LSRFFSRTNAGKFQMDVTQIREAFLFSEAIPERMRRFRDDRLAKVVARETPVPLIPGGPMILHLLPVSSFSQATTLDVATLQLLAIPPIETFGGGWNGRLNLDGFVTFSAHAGGPSGGYTQVFRNGCIEALDVVLPRSEEVPRSVLPATYESNLVRVLPHYLTMLNQLGVAPPILVFLSMFGTKGCAMNVQDPMLRGPKVIDRDALLLPETMLADCNEKPEVFMKPIFDAVWQSAGYARSWNYDDQGNWRPRV
jgi:hypothetical protein